MLAYSLMMAGTSLMVLLAGIIGATFAPSTDLATLPIALVVVGNDFLVFSVQATVSLSSGWFLFHLQWSGVILACLPHHMPIAFPILYLIYLSHISHS